MDDHSSDHTVADMAIAANPNLLGQKQPCRGPKAERRAVPIWHCSWWGLPSPSLLPKTWWALTPPFHPYPRVPQSGVRRRSVFCGAVRRVTPPGRYPAPLLFGVRTFLDNIAVTAIIQPSACGAGVAREHICRQCSKWCTTVYKAKKRSGLDQGQCVIRMRKRAATPRCSAQAGCGEQGLERRVLGVARGMSTACKAVFVNSFRRLR